MLNTVFPILTAVDGLFASFLPALVRVLIWGAIAGALAMLIYAVVSNQGVIARLKAEARDLRRRMLDPDLEQSEFARLVKVNLKTSFSLLGRTLIPGMLSALPVLLIAVWLDTFYGYAVPANGESVRLRVEPSSAAIEIEPADQVADAAGTDLAVKPLPAGEMLTVVVDGATAYVGNPFAPPVPVIARWQWWNALLANEAGYLAPQAAIDQIALELPRRHLIAALPDWLAGWEVPYFTSILVVALALKFGLRIE